MTLTGTRIDTYQYEAVKAQVFELFCTTRTGLADPRLRTSVHVQHRGFRNSRNTGGRSFAILDTGDYDGQFGYWVQDEDTFEEGFIAEDDEEEVFWQVDDNEAFVARRFKRRPQLRRSGKGRRKGKGRKRGRFRSNRKGSAHTAEGDDYNSSFYGKGKGKGKSKWKGGKEEADFVKGKGKGKNKGKGKGKPFAKGGKSFEAEGTTSQPEQAAATTAPSTEDWSWYTEENWSSWEEGAYLATHHKNKSKRKPKRGKNKKKLCIQGRGTDGPVHSKTNKEQEVPKYIASASTNDVAKEKKVSEISDHNENLSEISDYGAAHVVFADHVTALAVQFTTINLNKSPNYVILDSGCTRAMGSRYAIERMQRYVHDHCPGKIKFTFSPSGTKFSFANSQSARITEKVTLWFDTTPPANTTIEVLDEGRVPILFSIQQMRNLRMKLEHTPTADYATCEAFGLNRTVLPVSTNNHLVLNLLCFTRGPTYNMRDEEQTSFRATMLEEAKEFSAITEHALAGRGRPIKHEIKCKNCLGNKHKGHSWDKHCKLFIPGKTVAEMKSAFRKEEIRARKEKAKEDPSKKPLKAKAFARKPVPGDAVLKESASGSRPEPLGSKGQVEAGSGLPDKPPTEDEPQNPSDLFEDDEAWEKARDSLPEPPREEKVSGIPDNQVAGLPDEQEEKAEPIKLPIALRRIHDKLRDPSELYKLHLKHHHMSLSQFKKRTSALQIPKDIYEAYGELVKKCETCQVVKSAPSRAKTSGLRSDTFGDLTFVDHGEITLPSGLEKLMFIIFYDGATNLVTARAVENQTTESIIAQMTEYFEVYQPKVVVGDQQFMSVELEAYYARSGIKPVGIGPDTPWPNRAEAAVRLTKHQIKLMLDGLIKGFGAASLENVTYHSLVRQACMTRNSMVTYGGVTPLELAFGRRPRDIVTPENSDPAQLTGEPTDVEATAQAVRELAMRAYSAARQALDLRRDLAARLNMSEGPFSIGENVYYWNSATNARAQGDLSKQKTADGKRTGGWIKGKIVSTGTGAMVGVDLGTRIVRVNVSKLRRNADVFSDIEVPLAPLAAPKPEEAALAEGSPKSELSDSPGDHASALLTHDAKQTVDDMDISYEECRWQVTNTGKIDFLELFAGTARMSQMAAQSGLRCGQPIDLRTGFDLANPQSQKKVLDILEKQQPTIVFMAPVCGPFSQLQNLNSPYVHDKMKRAMPMIDFCIKVAEYQIKRGRYFIIENPQTSRIWYTKSFQGLLKQYDVDWDTLHMCAFGMKDPKGYYYYKPTSLMFNVPRDVMQVVFKTCPNRNSGKQSHQHETVMGNVPGYGQRSKLAQVYPYRFCKTLAVSLAHLLNRWQYGRSNMVVEDLLSELSDEEVSCLTNAFDQEYVFYTKSPHNHNKLKQDSNLRQLMTKVNSLKAGTEFHLNWANSEDKWVRTTRQQASQVRQRLVPGTVFGECILCRGTLGFTKNLRESQQGILVYWHKHNKDHAVSVKPVYEVDWKQIQPSTFSGVLYSHTGTSAKQDRTNDPHDVIMIDQMTSAGIPYDWPSSNQPDQPMPQYSWGPIGPISPRRGPVKRSDESASPERPVKPKQATPPAQVVRPSIRPCTAIACCQAYRTCCSCSCGQASASSSRSCSASSACGG